MASRVVGLGVCVSLFVACGGSVDNGGTGGAGAQAGSAGSGAQAGTGGSGGQGAYGGGGTGAVGAYGGTGAQGGVGAYGGGGMGAMGGGGMGAMGGGGMGAMGGGGMGAMGGTGGGDLNQKADALCASLKTYACYPPDCTNQLTQAISVAQSMGCTDVLGQLLDCALTYPAYCDPSTGQLKLSKACDPLAQAFGSCASNTQCQPWADSSGACGMNCSSWGVSCKPGGTMYYCSCTSGPKAGTAFQMTTDCNAPSWFNAVTGYCS